MLGWLRRWRAARAARAAVAREVQQAGGGDGGGEAEASDDGGGDGGDGGDTDDDGRGGGARGDGAGAADQFAGELDLHTFLPGECADVVEEYVRAAQEAGLPAVRIIHGKGKGTLRRTVHAVLARHPAVASFRLAEAHRGSWGATLVELRPAGSSPPAPVDR